MGFQRVIVVDCEKCAYSQRHSDASNLFRLDAMLVKEGWKIKKGRKGIKTYCPACSKQK